MKILHIFVVILVFDEMLHILFAILVFGEIIFLAIILSVKEKKTIIRDHVES